ncbi:MAG: M14 family zinc carboxypeptidase, partial [Eubacteriales bacterium]
MKPIRLGMSSNIIMEIQSTLQKMGYPVGQINGTYNEKTEEAVRSFQKDYELTPDGVIGPKTLDVLKRFLLGYTTYRLKGSDTLYRLARRTGTLAEAIQTANPGLLPGALPVGRLIVIPYKFNVVDTNINYTYDVLEHDILGLAARYPFLQVGVAGRSVMNRKLYYLRMGTGSHEVFYNAAHHAMEWITSPVIMKFAEEFCRAYAFGYSIEGYNPRDIWSTSSIYLVPMVNPDGVDLVLNGVSSDNPYYTQLIQWNMGSTDFSHTWDTNNHGVDLNHNYDAAWKDSVEAAAELGITGPAPRRYPGPYPESEPESH